jgi:conjugative transfer signal peptidase TraF
MKRAVIMAIAGLGVVATLAPLALKPSPALMWNATSSAPVGLYRVRSPDHLVVGDWVSARAPTGLAALFAARRYLPLNVPLVKQIAALPPSTVCRYGRHIAIDNRAVAVARSGDRLGRPLPKWRGCRRLAVDQVFLLNAAPDSLDGRYFGPVAVTSLIGRLTPLWIQGRALR